jgi:hypothetical protein
MTIGVQYVVEGVAKAEVAAHSKIPKPKTIFFMTPPVCQNAVTH